MGYEQIPCQYGFMCQAWIYDWFAWQCPSNAHFFIATHLNGAVSAIFWGGLFLPAHTMSPMPE